VYAGHASFALLAKSRRQRVSLALLVPVAFAPDWIEWVLAGRTTVVTTQDKFLSHALVFVIPCALVVGLVYWLLRRDRGINATDALTVSAVYLSHWAADFFTAIKPTWRGGPMVGLMLYRYVWPEALAECLLIVVCWLVYKRSLPAESRKREIAWVVPISLLVLELASAALHQPMS